MRTATSPFPSQVSLCAKETPFKMGEVVWGSMRPHPSSTGLLDSLEKRALHYVGFPAETQRLAAYGQCKALELCVTEYQVGDQ